MIYLDNGATSYPKPQRMYEAMEECMLYYCGNPGRSGHTMAIKTGEEVYKARKKVAAVFNIDNAERLIFTKNTTEAINLGIKGILKAGNHVISTSMEHNSVLRPLKSLESEGVNHTIVKANNKGEVIVKDIEGAIRENTELIVVTAASNVTGTRMPLLEIGKLAHNKGIKFMVDGAQGAGCMNLDVRKLGIDILAFPGHKGLLGPQGTGGLFVKEGIELKPLLAGGTGTSSKSRRQPIEFPDGYEAGTVNAPGIIGLGYAAEYISKIGINSIERYEKELIGWLDEELLNMNGIRVYGPNANMKTGISLINIEGMGSEEVTEELSRNYNIAVRGGFHCAGLAHKSIGTWEKGAVRISVGPFNTKKEMRALLEALRKINKYK